MGQDCCTDRDTTCRPGSMQTQLLSKRMLDQQDKALQTRARRDQHSDLRAALYRGSQEENQRVEKGGIRKYRKVKSMLEPTRRAISPERAVKYTP